MFSGDKSRRSVYNNNVVQKAVDAGGLYRRHREQSYSSPGDRRLEHGSVFFTAPWIINNSVRRLVVEAGLEAISDRRAFSRCL